MNEYINYFAYGCRRSEYITYMICGYSLSEYMTYLTYDKYINIKRDR